jgi:hypothetical protein
MRYKAVFAIGVATGYVLGCRAGRQRYEQIKRMAKSISQNPQVKHTADTMQSQATQLGTQMAHRMQAKAGTMSHDLREKMTSKLPSSLSNRFTHHTIDLEAESAYADGSMT